MPPAETKREDTPVEPPSGKDSLAEQTDEHTSEQAAETAPNPAEMPTPATDLLAPIKPAPDQNIPKFSTELDPEVLERQKEGIEQLRQLAQSDQVSLLELQGGWEWMGSDVNHDEKYAKMAQMYLTKREDSFIVRPELDNNYKTKMGIGAADLLPPSIKKVAITDTAGNRRIGTREIRNHRGISRVGYYDEQGYIPIFGGYKLTPVEYLKEDSTEVTQALESEKQAYLQKIEAAREASDHITGTASESPDYVRRPVATLKELRTSTQEDLSQRGFSRTDIERVEIARQDLKKVEEILQTNGIRISASSEIQGGACLFELNGEAAKLLDEKTINFILAMQNGDRQFPPGYSYIGTYELELTDLPELNNLANNQPELIKILDSLGGKTKKIDPDKVLESLSKVLEPDYRGMTLEQAIAYAKAHGLKKMLGAGGHQRLESLFRAEEGISSIDYDFNALQNQYDCTDTGPAGKLCCAFMTSRILGLRKNNGKGQFGTVSQLASRLIRGIMEKTGGATSGIVFGMENYQKGDVVVWNGYNYGGKNVNKFSHIGVVRDTLTINGERFIALQHDNTHLQIDIIPVNPNVPAKRYAHYLTASGLQELDPKTRAQLEDILNYRKGSPELVKFRPNAGWFGDSTKRRSGDIAFAIRASILQS